MKAKCWTSEEIERKIEQAVSDAMEEIMRLSGRIQAVENWMEKVEKDENDKASRELREKWIAQVNLQPGFVLVDENNKIVKSASEKFPIGVKIYAQADKFGRFGDFWCCHEDHITATVAEA